MLKFLVLSGLSVSIRGLGIKVLVNFERLQVLGAFSVREVFIDSAAHALLELEQGQGVGQKMLEHEGFLKLFSFKGNKLLKFF